MTLIYLLEEPLNLIADLFGSTAYSAGFAGLQHSLGLCHLDENLGKSICGHNVKLRVAAQNVHLLWAIVFGVYQCSTSVRDKQR